MSEVLELTLPSRIESVEEAAARTADFARGRHLDDDIASALDMAVRESVANAVKHGNKFDEAKTVEVTLADTDDDVSLMVRDFGSGFDVDGVPDCTDPENLLKTNGRGILFIRAFMDEVEWSKAEGGGTVTKMKKIKVKK
jgi:serine/threonine-protein kinase RsbW